MGTNWEIPQFYKREFPFLDNVLSEEHVQIQILVNPILLWFSCDMD